MADIELTDGFGLDVSAEPGPALTKYFKNPPKIALKGINLAQFASSKLSDPLVKSVTGGIDFSHPVDIDGPDVTLKAGGGLDGTLAIFVPEKDGDALFSPDLFGDNIGVMKNRRYLSLKLNATTNAAVSASQGQMNFGFKGSSSAILTSYRIFDQNDKSVIEAVKETIAGFVIPRELDDIKAMPAGDIATVEGTGTLKFSGSVNLASVTNPLATVDVPVAGTLAVSGGGSALVSANFEFSGDYQIRVQRMPGSLFRLGFYRKRESEYSVSAKANASISAKLGDDDLFVKIIQTISADPKADLKAVEAAGMPDAQADEIQKAIRNAVDRSLAIGAALELSAEAESDAMFLYEVDLSVLSGDGHGLLQAALGGNLSRLVSADSNLPAGVKVLKTLVSKTKTFQHSLKVNLLGIYNFLQISSLVVHGKTAWDATTGEIVMTDEATAAKIGVSALNLQADTKKLRHVMAQHFLATAVYRAAAKVVNSGPALSGTHSYFEMQIDASRKDVRTALLAAAALGLSSRVDALTRLPEELARFGEATVYAEATYDDRSFRALFFNGDELKNVNDYLSTGRQAITYLVQRGDDNDYRLKLAEDDGFFADLHGIANVAAAEFKRAVMARGISEDQFPFVTADYRNVIFLAHALQSAGQKLLAIDRFLSAHPNTDLHDREFLKLKSDLADHLAKVVDDATEDFGGPWGFNAMALLGVSSRQKWLLTNARVSGVLESPKAQVAPARA